MPKDIKNFTENLDFDLSSMYDEADNEVDESVIYPLSSSLKNKLDYREEEEVARGGEKKIFKAYDARSDRYIAMARPLLDSREHDERFLREARICARLEHPNIIPVYDIELDESEKPYFTMELLKGKTLKDVMDSYKSIEERGAHLAQLLEVFVKVCDALSYAHSKNVLHLDVKPENINVEEFGQVLLIDWGLAKIINDDSCGELFLNQTSLDMDILNDMTRVGTLKGSPGFMAPEQTVSNVQKTTQTDIYSLGALLYNILSGELHVSGDNVEECLSSTREGALRPFVENKINPIPKSLQAVFYKACKLEVEQRYQTVEELKQEIQSFLRGFATQAEEAGFLKQLQLIYQRNRIRCQLVFSFLIFTLVGTSIFIQALRESEAEAILARNNAEMALSLYEKEKRGRESIIAEFDDSLQDFKENLGSSSQIEAHFSRLLVGSAIASSRKLDFEMALALTELAIKKNPQDYNAIAEKGFIHLIRHEFVKANYELQRCATHAPHIYDIIRVSNNYVKIKPNDEKRLTNEQFLNCVEELPENRAWLKSYMLIYDRRVNPSIKAHSDLVKKYILSLNPKLTKENFNYKFIERPEGNHLDISHNPELSSLKMLGGKGFPYLSILRTLDLKTLNVSHTGLFGIKQLSQLGLKEINMANTHIKYFPGLNDFTLKPTIYVSKSQDLSKCPKDIKVIYVD
ncbi:hypothetical protein LNTAR_11186 [Lentisphaera araneosa HTCC2155]|uniref:Protein kinase domain-containing protein n=1 Tax=Lentisphaera araneosa HTCC2155 TaxID=313628 RepID=A6DJ40_9BACT|nr:serine/threonine-protein kinase [Lentisphaera araneosa]EDM28476.1 hypothetical protein LNTAR_11186 [Lentisphaera araneosa HTCC2155]